MDSPAPIVTFKEIKEDLDCSTACQRGKSMLENLNRSVHILASQSSPTEFPSYKWLARKIRHVKVEVRFWGKHSDAS